MQTSIETSPAPAPAIVNGSPLVAAQPANPLAMPASPRFVIERYEAIQEIIRGVFKDGVHYGEIPGTAKNKDGSAKKSLHKPGFDALCTAFQFSPDYTKQAESVESAGFINIVYKCVLTSATGRVVATGIGSCNSKEEKYRWTTLARTCPQCKGEYIRTSKPEDTQGFYCWKKLGGCGATFPKMAPEIVNQPEGRKENDNAWNFHNTITKMAQKRAGMAAIITACGISGDFTQDVEDFDLPHDKAKRSEEGIDVQANNGGWQAQEPREAESQPDWRSQAEETVRAEDAQFSPAEPALPADIQKAQADVLLELGKCEEKKHFQTLKATMQAKGGVYMDPRVTALVNRAYANRFPAKPQPGAEG